MANKSLPGDFESMVGGEDPEFSRIILKQMRGEPLTDQELRDIGEKPVPLPRPKPQVVNRAKKGNALLPIVARANGGMIDRAAVRGKTKGKIC